MLARKGQKFMERLKRGSVDGNGDLPAPQRGRQARADYEVRLYRSSALLQIGIEIDSTQSRRERGERIFDPQMIAELRR